MLSPLVWFLMVKGRPLFHHPVLESPGLHPMNFPLHLRELTVVALAVSVLFYLPVRSLATDLFSGELARYRPLIPLAVAALVAGMIFTTVF